MAASMEREHGRITLEKDTQEIGRTIKPMEKVSMFGAQEIDMKEIG